MNNTHKQTNKPNLKNSNSNRGLSSFTFNIGDYRQKISANTAIFAPPWLEESRIKK
jgi:hypothetical protein